MISIYRTQKVLRRLTEVSQHRMAETSRTKSLSCHLRLHAVPTIIHINASMNKSNSQGGCWVCVYIMRLYSPLIDLMTGEKRQSLLLVFRDQTKLSERKEEGYDVSGWNDVSKFCSCYSLPATKAGHSVEWKKAFHIAVKPPWILIKPVKLKALVEEGKELEGRTGAADIVREMEGEREMTLQRKKGGRAAWWGEGGRWWFRHGETKSVENMLNTIKWWQL